MMKKYASHAVILLIGILLGIIAANNYPSYQALEIDFLNHSAELLSPLAEDYDLVEKGMSQSNEEFRKAVLCRVLAQRKYVSVVMSRYDDSALNEVDRGVALLNYRDRILKKANNLVPEGIGADEYEEQECKPAHN